MIYIRNCTLLLDMQEVKRFTSRFQINALLLSDPVLNISDVCKACLKVMMSELAATLVK